MYFLSSLVLRPGRLERLEREKRMLELLETFLPTAINLFLPTPSSPRSELREKQGLLFV